MTTTSVIDPREVLTLIPYQLGFAPDHSMVVMSLTSDESGRTSSGTIRRIDLPPTVDLVSLAGWAATETEQADGVLAVIYLDDTARAEQAAQMLRLRLDNLRAVLVVTADGWFDAEADVSDIKPLPQDATTRIGAAMILREEFYAPTRETMMGQPEID
ncbi:DUF4192 family protein [Oerskovia sp. NPDC060338]|uniref:DUF4192 family protein n=1 Tax=Oerskovia sp. NPDC060338 TaxID=3347100 RepID=UPI003665BFD2